MVQAMNFESAKGKVFEVYNVASAPTNDWEDFFSGLQPVLFIGIHNAWTPSLTTSLSGNGGSGSSERKR
jgi:hypothetical protein